MLPFLKRKREPSAALALPAWHPNFRNFDRLPDTKVIRTAFFINIAASLVAVLMLLWFCYQEYQLKGIRRQVEDWQAQIARDQRGSSEAINKYKAFQASASHLEEIDLFLKSKPAVSPLLLRLGETLPDNVAIDSFELGSKGLRLTGAVRGSPDLATGHASAYRDRLRADEQFKEIFDTISLVNLNRNPQTGRIAVEFFLTLKPVGAKKP